ncbi:ABC transporter permease [Apilactobacillus timberlakei]|uniref:ABC transporter permease n=1 Tax=Apilactobacillus timberlakei TaxID=2008380 RepID=A0ABY2YRK3_9LACO|nr:ABC transporter permease [Apilactobacillus timberlakei]TPR12316.1 ABC transporter permease [Apilactobacillus timberlakei]TPR12919.1 ABC transporter permease [Apilactobacillus timberlakei]
MNIHIKTIYKKELLEIKQDKPLIASLLALPLILGVIFPTIFLSLGYDKSFLLSTEKISPMIKHFSSIIPNDINGHTEILYIILMYIFLPLFLIIPISISNVISSSSFVGEKENKTIEGLLNTPITNKELVFGKILSSVIPSILITWISMFIYGILIDVFGFNIFNKIIFPNFEWIFMALILAPMITILSIQLVICISSRVKTSKSAQSVAIVFIFPIVAFVISQASGLLIFGIWMEILLSFIILIINIIIFYSITTKIDREKLILNL